ncbi:hypothetical protein AVEN_18537-1 [Araneus ventricosus]|uniref:Uncharacterized protein n=2 Tax=Araneus ventricosus TaxID=182803 RepID=A0A4Y2S9D1_ARAVE|nr:hypothetical protein AVEN_18537-1 [Araneus ventricosus]
MIGIFTESFISFSLTTHARPGDDTGIIRSNSRGTFAGVDLKDRGKFASLKIQVIPGSDARNSMQFRKCLRRCSGFRWIPVVAGFR